MEEHFHPYQPPTVIILPSSHPHQTFILPPSHPHQTFALPPSQVPQSQLDLAQVRSILAEYRIHNADITLRCDATADDLIDVVEGNRSVCGEFKQVERNGHVSSSLLVSFHRVYIPCIYVLNKIDQISIEVGISCPYHFQIYICTLTSSLLLSRFLSSSSHSHASGVGHYLQDSAHCTHFCPSQVEL